MSNNKVKHYPPGDVTITPGNDTFYTKRGGKPLHDITCEADCVPECTYTWYREGYRYWYTAGNSLFATRSYYYSGSSRFQCLASNAFEPYRNYSRWITVKVKDGPDNVTIIPSLPAIENSTFTLTCVASCYHGCQSYSWYHDGRSVNQRTKVLEFHRLSKEDSGRYRCQVTDYFGEKSGYYTMTVQYKPVITSTKNQTTITAPDLLDLTFSVDGSPSSNVTIFHETKTLTFLPHVTGQLSFNVSIESCLDQGEYRVEAVNDVGFGSFNFMPNIKCSPIVVRHSSVADKEFRVGDLLHLTVTFMANPTAEVLWSFVPWNQNTSLEVQTQQIQTHKESTKLVLILSDTDKFGKYILELKNELGKISKEFNIQGPIVAATKTDPGTTISSRDSDSDEDCSMSPTSWKGKTNALRETEMNTFLLQQDKLHEEVQKLRLEGDVLRLKRNYYVIKLQVLMKEHPDIIDEVFGED
uniref:Ig-like domain-containing protein n=1 Tax=Magallana gigas TaxID=29159 RepID=A0A8W8KY94_MAGGI